MADAAAARRVRPSEEEEFTKLLALLEARSQLMARLFGILCGDEEAAQGQQRDETVQGLQECRAQEARFHELLQERLELADLIDQNHPAPWQHDNAQARARLQSQLDRVAATGREVEALHASLQGAVGQARELLMSKVRAAASMMRATNVEVRQVQHMLLDQQRQREQAAQRWSPEPDAAGTAAAVAAAAAAGGGDGFEAAAAGQRLLLGGEAFGAVAATDPLVSEQKGDVEEHFSGLSRAFEDFSAGLLASITEAPGGGQQDGLQQQGSLQAPLADATAGADQNALAAFQLKQQLLEQQDGAATDWSNRHEQLLTNLRELRVQALRSHIGACAPGAGAAAAEEEEVMLGGMAEAEAFASATSTSSMGLEVPSQAPITAKEAATVNVQQVSPVESTFTPTTGSIASDAADRSLCSEPTAEVMWPQPQAEVRELPTGSVVSEQSINVSTPRGAGAGRGKAAPNESPGSCKDQLSSSLSQSRISCEAEQLSLVEKLWAQLEVTAGHAQARDDEARRLQQLVLEQQQQQQAAQQQWVAQQQQLLAELQELRDAVASSKAAPNAMEAQELPAVSAAAAAAAAAASATPAATLALLSAMGGASRLQSGASRFTSRGEAPPSSPPTLSRASRLQSREECAGTAVIRASAEAERSGLSTIAFIQVKEEEESVAWSEALAAQQALQAKDRELEEALAGALAAQASAKEEVAGIAASAQDLESCGASHVETTSQVFQLQAKLQEAMEKVRANSDEVWSLQLQLIDRQRQQELVQEAAAKIDGEVPQVREKLQVPGVEPRRDPETPSEEADAFDQGTGPCGTPSFPRMQRSPRPPAGKEAEPSPRTVVRSGSEVCFGSPKRNRQVGQRVPRTSVASVSSSGAGSPRRSGSTTAPGGRQPAQHARAKAAAAATSGRSPSRPTSPGAATRAASPRTSTGANAAAQGEGQSRSAAAAPRAGAGKARGQSPSGAATVGTPAPGASLKPTLPLNLASKERRASLHLSQASQEGAKGAPALPTVGSPFDMPRKSVRRRQLGGAKSPEQQQPEGDEESSVNATLDLSTSLDGSARAPSPQLRRTRSTSLITPQPRATSLEKRPQPKQPKQQKQAPSQAAAPPPKQAQPQPAQLQAQPQPQPQASQGTFLHRPQVLHQQPQILHQPQAQPQAQPQQPQPQQPPQLQPQSPRAVSPTGGRMQRLGMPTWPSQQPLGGATLGGTPLVPSPAAAFGQIPAAAMAMTPSGLSGTASPLGSSLTLNLQPRIL